MGILIDRVVVVVGTFLGALGREFGGVAAVCVAYERQQLGLLHCLAERMTRGTCAEMERQ